MNIHLDVEERGREGEVKGLMWEIECPYKSSLKGANEIYLKSQHLSLFFFHTVLRCVQFLFIDIQWMLFVIFLKSFKCFSCT